MAPPHMSPDDDDDLKRANSIPQTPAQIPTSDLLLQVIGGGEYYTNTVIARLRNHLTQSIATLSTIPPLK